MTAKVVTGLSGNRAIAAEILDKAGFELVRLSLATEDDVVKNAADAVAVLAGPNEPYTKKVLRSMTKCKVISRVGIGFDSILKDSDFISLHAPLRPETKKLFGLKEFRKMKPTAYIINLKHKSFLEKGEYDARIWTNGS